MGRTRKEKRREIWHIGDFQVDTGTAIIGDPCHVEDVEVGVQDLDERGTSCPIASNGMGRAVFFQTGMGDGIYPVFAEFEDGPLGRAIARIYVEFTNPLRGKGCSEPYPHAWSEGCLDGSTAANRLRN